MFFKIKKLKRIFNAENSITIHQDYLFQLSYLKISQVQDFKVYEKLGGRIYDQTVSVSPPQRDGIDTY